MEKKKKRLYALSQKWMKVDCQTTGRLLLQSRLDCLCVMLLGEDSIHSQTGHLCECQELDRGTSASKWSESIWAFW